MTHWLRSIRFYSYPAFPATAAILMVMLLIWESNEPNTSAESTGVTCLDDYIREHYHSLATLGNYQVWECQGNG